MADREKAIKGLEICVDRVPGKYTCNECPYEIDGNYCEINLAKDAITLLKEQEAVEPYQHDAVWLCGNCEKEVVGWTDDITGEDIRYPFCRQCGRPVKWE